MAAGNLTRAGWRSGWSRFFLRRPDPHQMPQSEKETEAKPAANARMNGEPALAAKLKEDPWLALVVAQGGTIE
ncbi:MAG: hypothetical protein J7639_08050 [Paenibacillaceae bacterium]|nr:hypothetical protein [Paenibacillaceae bacterium]